MTPIRFPSLMVRTLAFHVRDTGFESRGDHFTLRFGRRRATVHRTVCALPQTLNRADVFIVQLIFYDVFEERYDAKVFHNKTITFSGHPKFIDLKENTSLKVLCTSVSYLADGIEAELTEEEEEMLSVFNSLGSAVLKKIAIDQMKLLVGLK